MNSPTFATVTTATTGERLASLDFFRGSAIMAMILVNNPGIDEPYWPLKHANWSGLTPTDLIAPFFLFIAGVSLVYSFQSRHGQSKSALLFHVLGRCAVIFAIGLFLNAFPFFYLTSLRVPGVLQRIALASMVAAILTLWLGWQGRIATVFALLVGYWMLLRLVPVPGYGIPGRDIPFLDPNANLAAYLDRKLMLGHLMEGTSDPMGLLSTLPAIATTLFGTLTGEWLRSNRGPRQKVAWMVILGIVGMVAGKILGVWFPLNRKLWTSSYVLFTAGAAMVCLALCYWALDIKLWRRAWTRPFIVFGTNAIAAYTLAELVEISGESFLAPAGGETFTWQESIFRHVFAPLGSPTFASLLYSITIVAVCLFPIWALYRKQFFIKI